MDLTERMQRTEEVRRAYAILENQRKMMLALQDAVSYLSEHEPAYESAQSMMRRVAVETVLNVQRIWKLTLPKDHAAGMAGADSGEARDETVPW